MTSFFAAWLISMCDMTYHHVRHDSSLREAWLIKPTYRFRSSHAHMHARTRTHTRICTRARAHKHTHTHTHTHTHIHTNTHTRSHDSKDVQLVPKCYVRASILFWAYMHYPFAHYCESCESWCPPRVVQHFMFVRAFYVGTCTIRSHTTHGGDQTRNVWISRLPSFPGSSFEWQGLSEIP